MNIFRNEPTSWRDLEIKVTELMNGAGYVAINNKKISTVRGNVNIDVFAEDLKSIPKSTYLIECKYWETDIPQTIVHAFRTVVNDYGANHELIISKNNFQSGALEAIKNTNIQLLNWNDFHDLFEARWIAETIKSVNLISLPLRDYTDPLDDIVDFSKLSQTQKQQYLELCKKYIEVAVCSSPIWYGFNNQGDMFNKDHLDTVIIKNIDDCFPLEGIECYNDFFQILSKKCMEGIKEFSNFVKSSV
jgi:hypothetical protein